MTRLSLPSTAFRTAFIERLRNDQYISLSSGQRQVLKGRIDDFIVGIGVPAQEDDQARLWRTFIMQAAEFGNDFLLGPPDHKTPTYTGPEPIINGPFQTGKNFACDGVDNNALILQAGAYLSIDERLNFVTADVTSNASGQITLPLAKPIVIAPADNALVSIRMPQGAFEYIESKGRVEMDYMRLNGVSFLAQEVR